jgi:hypothetical protein
MARLNTVQSFRGTTKTEDGKLTCGSCGEKVDKGDSYRWWANRAPGSRGGIRRIRCMKPECKPSRADLTPGRRGQLLGIQESIEDQLTDWNGDTTDDLQSIAEEAAGDLRSLGEELTEGADNMEQGFGHETEQSMELREKGESLESVAQELEYLDFEDPPEKEEPDEEADEEADEEQDHEEGMDAWRESQRELITEKLYEAEV